MRLAFVLLVAANIAVLAWGLLIRTPPAPAEPPAGGSLLLVGEQRETLSAVTAIGRRALPPAAPVEIGARLRPEDVCPPANA